MSETFGGRLIEMDGMDVAARTAPEHKRAVEIADFATRNERIRRAAVDAGLIIPQTFLPPGTALYDSGEQKLLSDRKRWQSWAHVKNGLPVVSEYLKAQDRRDFEVDVRDLRMLAADGRIVRANNADGSKGALGYSEHAFRQFVGQVPGYKQGQAPRNHVANLLHLDADERAAIVNRRLARAGESKATMRTKLADDGNRVARAVLSEKYGSITDVQVAEALAEILGDVGNGRLDYKPGDNNSRFEVVYPSEIPVHTFRVADPHYLVLQVENSETGMGSWEVNIALLTAACANLTLVMSEGMKVRHVGNAAARMKEAIRAVSMQVEPFIAEIQKSARTVIPDDKTVGEVFAALARKFKAPEERAQAWTETYAKTYAPQEERATAWGVASAITDAAQQLPWWRQQKEEEQVASQVVHVRWDVFKN